MIRISNSMEWVAHNRGHSEELVRRREKECWEALFRGKSLDFILRKLSNLLPADRKAVTVSSSTDIIIVDPHLPEEMATTLQEVFDRACAPYTVVIVVRAIGVIPQSPVATDPTDRIRLSAEDTQYLTVLFGGKNLGYIADRLNIVWLRDDVKILFPHAWKEVITVDRHNLLDTLRQAKDLLSLIGSKYDIDVEWKESVPRSVFMEAI